MLKKILNSVIILMLVANIYIFKNIAYFETLKGNFQVTFLDIGQGDSMLIKTPNNHFGLIDGGKSNKVITELEQKLPKQYLTFDFVIFSHPDLDHIGGLLDVLKDYEVKNVFINKVNKDSTAYTNAKNLIKEKHLKNYQLNDLNDFEIDGIKVQVLWPEHNVDVYKIPESNNTSITVLISYKNFTLFSGGDLESQYEEKLAQDDHLKDIDVLKVGHHGSKNSTSLKFAEEIKPKVAVISVGKDNTYGHPTKQVLNNLSATHSDIFRTDEDGTITINVRDEKEFEVEYKGFNKTFAQ